MSATIILDIPRAEERRVLAEATIGINTRIYQEMIINRAHEKVNKWFRIDQHNDLTSATIFVSTMTDNYCTYYRDCISSIISTLHQEFEALGYSVKVEYINHTGELGIFLSW